MSVQRIIRVTCDHCGSSVIVNTADTLEASRMLTKRNWVFHRLDFYGNEAEFCNSACRDLWLDKLKEIISC